LPLTFCRFAFGREIEALNFHLTTKFDMKTEATIKHQAPPDTKRMLAEVFTDLSIGDEIYALSLGNAGIDYILYPKEDKIMKGVVTGLVLNVTKNETKIQQYHSDFGGNNYSFFPVNIGTFIFRSESELKEHFSELREERRRNGQFV
jgi:hypothetical protein